jgi:hypothetical protein
MQVTSQREEYVWPFASVVSQELVAVWKCADDTLVLNCMSGLSWNLSTMNCAYLRVSGWGEKCSVQSHSLRSSSEKLKM